MKWGTLVLTRADVRPDSVRVFGPDKGANLAFAFASRTSEEIEKIRQENMGKKVPIQTEGKVVAVGRGAGTLAEENKTVGLVLIFETKAEAKLAARVLRGAERGVNHHRTKRWRRTAAERLGFDMTGFMNIIRHCLSALPAAVAQLTSEVIRQAFF